MAYRTILRDGRRELVWVGRPAVASYALYAAFIGGIGTLAALGAQEATRRAPDLHRAMIEAGRGEAGARTPPHEQVASR